MRACGSSLPSRWHMQVSAILFQCFHMQVMHTDNVMYCWMDSADWLQGVEYRYTSHACASVQILSSVSCLLA